MNVEWRGPSDMTLHRLDREEILRELDWIRRNTGEYESSEVVSVNRHGRKSRIVRVEERDNGVFLYTLEESFGNLIALAPYMGSDMRIMDFGGIRRALEECGKADVWLQWPSDDPHTVIGKILAVNVGGRLIVSLSPVPKDIEEVNREVHRRVAEKCELAKNGTECGECPMLGGCETLKEVDDEITQVRDGLQQEHAGRETPDVSDEEGHLQ